MEEAERFDESTGPFDVASQKPENAFAHCRFTPDEKAMLRRRVDDVMAAVSEPLRELEFQILLLKIEGIILDRCSAARHDELDRIARERR